MPVRNVNIKCSGEAACWLGWERPLLMPERFATNTEEVMPAAPTYLENIHPCDPAPCLGRKLKEMPSEMHVRTVTPRCQIPQVQDSLRAVGEKWEITAGIVTAGTGDFLLQ